VGGEEPEIRHFDVRPAGPATGSLGDPETHPGQPELPGWFGVPVLPVHYVTRPRLLEALDPVPRRPLTVVSAPAGSGKTSLVAEWVTASGMTDRTAWVSVEDRDEDLWRALLACFEWLGVSRVPPRPSGRAGALERRTLASLAGALALHPDRMVVVVDGYELASPEVADDLDYLLEHAGHRLQLVLVTRVDPMLPLYRYRLRDAVTEIRMADLAFDDAEAAQLVEGAGVTLSAASVQELNARTRGWVTGLRFAAKVLAGRSDPDGAVADVAVDDANIAEYLLGEVLAQQTPSTRKLLLSTSVPDVIRPGLAEALAGRSAPRRLSALTTVNVFIEPVPGHHPGAYRYHPLFRDLLRAELDYESPRRMASLHRKAARWYAGEALLAPSVEHFAAARAWGEAAGEVVAALAVWELLANRGTGPVARSMRPMPDDVPGAAPALVRATLALADGAADRFDAELRQARDLSGEAGEHPSVLVVLAVLLAIQARVGDEPDLAISLADDAEGALEQRDPASASTHPELVALVLVSKGIATAAQGRLGSAHEIFTAAARVVDGPGHEALLVECLGYLGLVAALEGRVSRARVFGDRALAVAERAGIPPEDRQAAAEIALAWADLEQDQGRQAESHLRRARRSGFLAGDRVAGTMAAAVTAGLTAADDPAPARAPAAGPARASAPPTRAVSPATGETPFVEALTPKELEVLQHLAELLTTEEIAAAMFVSVNTVRTHVRSILRKLGVPRRNAAIRRARELRLLNN
jgi:LuxR family maltose regulon positive regulatory protein